MDIKTKSRIKTILSIIIIVGIILAGIRIAGYLQRSQFILPLVYGQENFSEMVEKVTTQMIADCAVQMGTEPVTTYTLLCRSFMNDTDKVCQQTYHSYCFGTNWKDYDLTKHVNPP